MNPTLEQIKTDESVWPDGATHKMNGSFYIKKDQDFYDIQADRMPVMAWDGQEWQEMHLIAGAPLIEIEPKEHEYMPEVGEWFTASNGDHYLLVGKSSHSKFVVESRETVLNVFRSLNGAKPIKTERELLIDIIEATGNMSNGVLADNILNSGFVLKEPAK